METMSLNDVCKLLQITTQTGRNRLSMKMPMPPNFRVGRRRLFIAEEVSNWIKQQCDTNVKPQSLQHENYPPSLRGRPTKASLYLNKK